MDLLDGFWHLLNLFGPAMGMGAVSALFAKLLWWRELKGVGWLWLAGWAVASASLVLLIGLAWTGRDGKMITYGAMVLGCAVALWWAGWGAKRQ